MRIIYFIIALLSTLPFLLAIFFLCVSAIWLQRYYPNAPTQKIANVIYSSEGSTKFEVLEGCSSLEIVIGRNTTTCDQHNQIVTIEYPTLQGFAVYQAITLREQLVPLGFFAQYRLVEITDAEGKIHYSTNNDFVDEIMRSFIGLWGKNEEVVLPLLATKDDSTYTVTISDAGVIQNEN